MSFRFSRDPALYVALVAGLVKIVSAFVIQVSPDVQTAINAVAAAVAAAIVAVVVQRDGQVPAILGVFQAVLALVVGLGLHLSADQQALIMSTLGLIAAAFVRTQVVAPVASSGARQA